MYRISVIKHSQQRYNTVGDYQTKGGVTEILISKMSDWRYEFLIAIHEVVETALCRHAGITDTEIDEFDFAFDENRAKDDSSEPGDDSNCPYYKQHQAASIVERSMAVLLGVHWNTYESEIAMLMEGRSD